MRQYKVFEKTKVLLYADAILEVLNKGEYVSVYSQRTASGSGKHTDYNEACIFLEITQDSITKPTLTIGVLHETKILDVTLMSKRVHKNRHLTRARKVIGSSLPVGTTFVYNSLDDTISKM